MIEVLRQLSEEDLRQIGRALRSGRLSPPFTGVALRRYLAGEPGEVLAGEMQRLCDEGLSPEHLALMLDLLAEDRSRRAGVADAIDLVSTGPEAPGIANRDTAVVVRELFSNARESVLVAGYAVHQGRQVFKALAGRMDQNPDLQVRMFLDVQRHPTDTSKSSEILARFAERFKAREWPGSRLPEVFYDPRSLEPDSAKRASLHAKCIVVDGESAFVSSANFTEAAQVRNIEVGVLIRSKSFVQRLAYHFGALAKEGILRPVPGV